MNRIRPFTKCPPKVAGIISAQKLIANCKGFEESGIVRIAKSGCEFPRDDSRVVGKDLT
jgi:hypothetical protein